MEVVPLSALPQAALMRVFCSWKVALSDGGRACQCAVPGCSDEGLPRTDDPHQSSLGQRTDRHDLHLTVSPSKNR